MRFLLFFFLIIISAGLSAQEKRNLVGKWKVVAIDDGEVFMDLKTDSAALKASLKKPEDSAMVLELLSITAEAFGDVEIIFGQTGAFEKRYNGKPDEKGTYVMATNGKVLTTNTRRYGKKMVQRMTITFLGERLQLAYLDNDEYPLVLTLEKMK